MARSAIRVSDRSSSSERRLVVVANRLPVQRSSATGRWTRSAGGLVTAMEPVLRARRGVWVGWAGGSGPAPRPFRHEGLDIRPIRLDAREVAEFYDGMSNRTLWPLYHDAIRTPEFHRHWWHAYNVVNERYARAAVRASRGGDLVWVHDYQLQLVPQFVRARRPRQRIGFFNHIPFPPEELFAWLPWRTALLRGILAADVIGFQTAENAQNFARLARRFAGAGGSEGELSYEGRRIRAGAYPISIDYASFAATAAKPSVIAEAKAIRERVDPKRRIILCVDRLDYTKGIDVRLEAYEELLRAREISAQDTVLVQIAVPTREPVPDYSDMRGIVEQAVGRINGDYGEPGRVAVHFLRRSVSRDQLVAYYLAADVMLVTPLRDGMNLVAKEFVASRVDGRGVLVLSEFAGAAKELRKALLVNPRDIDGLCKSILDALRMPKEEARRRMLALRAQVRLRDVDRWARTFLEDLDA